MLPPELLSMVFSHSSKPDLKNLRLVCQSYQQAAAPFLFDEVFISFDFADLRTARSLILRFSKHIRTLVFSSIFYEDIDKHSFLESFGTLFDYSSHKAFHDKVAHGEHALGLYSKTLKLQKEVLMSCACQAHLTFALCRLSNLRRIILTDESSSRAKPRLGTTQSARCPDQDCELEDLEHLHLMKRVGLDMEGPSNPWRTTLLALSTTNSRIPEITMDYRGGEKVLNTAAFKLLPSELEDAKVCMQTLVKLRLTLHVTPERITTSGETHYVHRNVSKLLRAAVNLECLALEAYDNNIFPPIGRTTTLKAMLGKCEFPKLRSLFLTLFNSTYAELLRFLKHSPQLGQLTLECYALTSGSWALFAEEVRRALPLKSVQLNELYGGFPPPQENTEFMNYFDSVADFFLRNGKNTFTKEAIERYLEDVETGRERHYPSNYIETYNAFH